MTINFYTNGEPSAVGGTMSVYYSSPSTISISGMSNSSSSRTTIGGSGQSQYTFPVTYSSSSDTCYIYAGYTPNTGYTISSRTFTNITDHYGNGGFLFLSLSASNYVINVNFDDDNVWTEHIGDASFSVGDGKSWSTAYEISTPEQLALIASYVNSGGAPNNYQNVYFKQTKDLDMGKYRWTPIGNGTFPFVGNFDGNGYEIRGLNVKAGDYAGLFGRVYYNGGNSIRLQNITVADSYISGGSYVGAVVGYYETAGGRLENCHNKNTTVIATGDSVGGLAGYRGDTYGTNNYTINCTNTGDVCGVNYVGGIVGYATTSYHGSYITNCINNGTVISTGSRTGGIVGSGVNCTISNCIVNGKVIAQGLYVGGFAGLFDTPSASGISNASSVSNCAFYGTLISTNSNDGRDLSAGLFVGGNSYTTGATFTFSNCSFYGSCTEEANTFSRHYHPTISNCYAYVNGQGYYTSSGDFSGFTVVENMNNNLPMQNALFNVAVGTGENALDYMKGLNFTSR